MLIFYAKDTAIECVSGSAYHILSIYNLYGKRRVNKHLSIYPDVSNIP